MVDRSIKSLRQVLPCFKELTYFGFAHACQFRSSDDVSTILQKVSAATVSHLDIAGVEVQLDAPWRPELQPDVVASASAVVDSIARMGKLRALCISECLLKAASARLATVAVRLSALQHLALTMDLTKPDSGMLVADVMRSAVQLKSFDLRDHGIGRAPSGKWARDCNEMQHIAQALGALQHLQRFEVTRPRPASTMTLHVCMEQVSKLIAVTHLALDLRPVAAEDNSRFISYIAQYISGLRQMAHLRLGFSTAELQRSAAGRQLWDDVAAVTGRPAECVLAPANPRAFGQWCQLRGEQGQ